MLELPYMWLVERGRAHIEHVLLMRTSFIERGRIETGDEQLLVDLAELEGSRTLRDHFLVVAFDHGLDLLKQVWHRAFITGAVCPIDRW